MTTEQNNLFGNSVANNIFFIKVEMQSFIFDFHHCVLLVRSVFVSRWISASCLLWRFGGTKWSTFSRQTNLVSGLLLSDDSIRFDARWHFSFEWHFRSAL